MNEEEVDLVAVAVDEVQARIYRRLLEERGIQVLLLDADDKPIEHIGSPADTKKDIRVIASVEDLERAQEIIHQFESKRITKAISKSGSHMMFRCPHCGKYLAFPAKERGTQQFCPKCLKIIDVPE